MCKKELLEIEELKMKKELGIHASLNELKERIDTTLRDIELMASNLVSDHTLMIQLYESTLEFQNKSLFEKMSTKVNKTSIYEMYRETKGKLVKLVDDKIGGFKDESLTLQEKKTLVMHLAYKGFTFFLKFGGKIKAKMVIKGILISATSGHPALCLMIPNIVDYVEKEWATKGDISEFSDEAIDGIIDKMVD